MGHLRAGAVTIGIATWNRRPLLQKAVESALSQTYGDVEIVVSDDGSTDDTAEYLRSISGPQVVKVLKPKNEGLVANYNTCLNSASSEFFLLLNDDDTLLPTAVEKLVTAFLKPPNNICSNSVGVSWCPFTNIDANGDDLWTVRGGPAVESTVGLIEGLFNGIRGPLCSGVLIRTEDALAAGGYESRFRACCDSALWGKAALRHEYAVCVDEPLMRYLMHPSGSATADAECAAWQGAMQMEIVDFVDILRKRGDETGAQRLLRAGSHTLANITVTVLMRSVGRPGWVKAFAREFWRSRKYVLTPFVLKRAFKDGWKLLRLRNSTATVKVVGSPGALGGG